MTEDRPPSHATEPILQAGAPAGASRAALVVVHGRGATAQGAINLFEPLSRHGLAVFAPQAFRGRWYPSTSTPETGLEPDDPWLAASIDRVETCLERAASVGIGAERTVLVGFSQGARVVAGFLCQFPRRYGGAGILAGTVPGVSSESDGSSDRQLRSRPWPQSQSRRRPPDGSLEGTPILLAFGDDDPYVSPAAARASATVLEELGGDVEVMSTPDTGHAVSDEAFVWFERRTEAVLESATR
ncbi:alpha/beta hydrolase [Natronosalvus halobius]|uniref:alpha/beta hydrolase n=1 Tax=Natronosalvus halobius TaxID=2953746 RepID=UPI00209E72CE|nr:phospholipase [Natronosalvus halobius]USZ72971.1 phospholipase [Natronosalvus halobius]